MQVPTEVRCGEQVLRSHSTNLSAGGACIACEGESPDIGKTVELELGLGPQLTTVTAEVRWKRSGMLGLMFSGGAKTAVAAFIMASLGATAANAASAGKVPTFDANADVVMDMDAGGERPDDYAVLQAFEQQYGQFDVCLQKAKRGRDHQIPGDVDVEVLLDPKNPMPLGVNALLPGKMSRNKALNRCLRTAIAAADYPVYDGPPVVVSFSFELDPGYDMEEADEDDY